MTMTKRWDPFAQGDESDEEYAARLERTKRLQEEYEAEKRRREDERRQRRRYDLSALLRLPPPVLRGLVDGTVDDTEAIEHAKRFLAHDQRETFRPVLGLLGPKGNGKTTAAGYVLLEHGQERGRKGAVITADELASTFNGFSTHDERRAEVMGADILIVDDVGTARPEAERAAIHEVIDGRCNRFRKLTVFSTNLSTKRLVAYLDDRTVDRLRALTHWGLCFGSSLRQGHIPGVD